jgi:hypothetical protein
MTVFWDIAPYKQMLTSNSKMSVNIYQTAQRNVLEISYLHILRRDNLKTHLGLMYIKILYFLYSSDT